MWILYSKVAMLENMTLWPPIWEPKISLLTTKVLLSVFSEHLNFFTIIQL